MNTPDGYVFVAHRTTANAKALLAAAKEAKVPAREVRANLTGFTVPEKVAEKYEAAQHKSAPATKSAPKKTPAKKTSGKKSEESTPVGDEN